MKTAIEILEKHGVDTEAIELDAEYSFANILRAMEEYANQVGQIEPLVMQLAAFIHFLCQYHEDAKESRNKIALASTLKEARETAMFDYPVAQGIEFNMDIYKIAQAKLDINKNGNIQKAVEYMLKLSSQSA